MQSILDAINEWIKEILIGAINGNLSTMFGDVNEKVGTIAAEVGQTPQGWNAGISVSYTHLDVYKRQKSYRGRYASPTLAAASYPFVDLPSGDTLRCKLFPSNR